MGLGCLRVLKVLVNHLNPGFQMVQKAPKDHVDPRLNLLGFMYFKYEIKWF